MSPVSVFPEVSVAPASDREDAPGPAAGDAPRALSPAAETARPAHSTPAAARVLSGSWVEVDVSAIRANIRAVKAFVGPKVAILAVVKTDAYGHGLLAAARTACEEGCMALAVGRFEEGLALRENGIECPILLIGPPPVHGFAHLIRARITPIISSFEHAAEIACEAESRGRPVAVHVKVDTGMGRLGFSWREFPDAALALAATPGLVVEGICSHFSCAERPALPFTRKQIVRFRRALKEARSAGLSPSIVHTTNSGGVLFYPEAHFNAVRPGLLLYGLRPGRTPIPAGLSLRPALSLKARLALVKRVPKGTHLSYGATFRTLRNSVVGVIPAGYADGFPRRLSNRGYVLAGGRRCPIAGRICMDQSIVDLTDVPGARAGDEVVILGRQGREEITVFELSQDLSMTPHEVTTLIPARVPRIYRSPDALAL